MKIRAWGPPLVAIGTSLSIVIVISFIRSEQDWTAATIVGVLLYASTLAVVWGLVLVVQDLLSSEPKTITYYTTCPDGDTRCTIHRTVI